MAQALVYIAAALLIGLGALGTAIGFGTLGGNAVPMIGVGIGMYLIFAVAPGL